jgi:hypothetical protein
MKKISYSFLLLLLIIGNSAIAQKKDKTETYGHTINLGIGAGYIGILPVLYANYEIDIAKNVTLAPFISFYTYRNHSVDNSGVKFYYHETAIPTGMKGMYYFDELLHVKPNWDLYAGASSGFAIINSSWDTGYTGSKDGFNGANPFFVNVHAGATYHFNNKAGAYLDLSDGLSTIGFTIHL